MLQEGSFCIYNWLKTGPKHTKCFLEINKENANKIFQSRRNNTSQQIKSLLPFVKEEIKIKRHTRCYSKTTRETNTLKSSKKSWMDAHAEFIYKTMHTHLGTLTQPILQSFTQ